MQYGDDISQVKCPRCHVLLGMRNITFQDGMLWHTECLRSGERALANAKRIYTVLNGEILLDEPTP